MFDFSRLRNIPSALSGLALGVVSLGWLWSRVAENESISLLAALVASVLLIAVALKFLLQPQTLKQDLACAQAGSVIATFSMASMIVGNIFYQQYGDIGRYLWAAMVAAHLLILLNFVTQVFKYHRLSALPSWFVPTVGIIVAVVTNPDILPETATLPVVHFGIVCYLILLPLVLLRVYQGALTEVQKPLLAIFSAPPSLCLLGYLTVTESPESSLLVLLTGFAILSTFSVYVLLIPLLRGGFSPALAACTFPLVVSASALTSLNEFLARGAAETFLIQALDWVAGIELAVATIAVVIVASRFALHYSQVVVRR